MDTARIAFGLLLSAGLLARPERLLAVPGDLDPTFGVAGKVITHLPRQGRATSVLIDPDQNIVTAGWADSGGPLRFAIARYNYHGVLDNSFGTAGVTIVDSGVSALAEAVLLQPDGKLLVVGGEADRLLARLHPDGTVDSTFGVGGNVITSGIGLARAAALLADGRILTVGGDFVAAQYTPNGQLDESFGVGGTARIDFGTATQEVLDSVLQPDGKLVAAGVVGTYAPRNLDFGIARYNQDGTPDSTFGDNGKIIADAGTVGDAAWSVALQGSSILVAGITTTAQIAGPCAVLRFDEYGTLDPGFAGGGKLILALGGSCQGNRVLVRPDGRILLFGHTCGTSFNNCNWFLSGFLSDGAVDSTVGGGGSVITRLSDQNIGADLALQKGGRAVGVGAACAQGTGCAFGVARYLTTNCGDGVVEIEEECDDGNRTDGDGCDSNCTESGCGNGVVGLDETCDDGNSSESDGCDGNCQLEAGWACGGRPYRCTRDRRVSGARLSLRRTGSGKEKAVFVSRDPALVFPVSASGDDPVVVGATVDLLSPAEGSASFDLPASNWSVNPAGMVYKFLNATAPDATSTVKVAIIKHGKLLKVVSKDVGLPLAGPQGSVGIRIQTGLLRNCARFGPGTIVRDEVGKFIAKNASASGLADCSDASLLGSASGAFVQ